VTANIFTSSDFGSIVERVNKLSNQSQRQWGKMNCSQMLEHCVIQLRKAMETSPAMKAEGPAFFRTAIGRWMVLYLMPWPKGSATPADMNMEINGIVAKDIEDEKEQLLDLLQQVQTTQQFGIHPFFGALNKKDWGRLIWKHLDHHLRQFGQ
jgi:hypothetical protein